MTPKLYTRREVWSLTWTGTIVFSLLVAGMIVILGRGLCVFLAVSSPVNGRFLVIEKWMPAHAYREAVSLFARGGYAKILLAGEVDEDWDSAANAEPCLRDESLMRFGAPLGSVVVLTADKVERDRTLHAALTVKRWLSEQNIHGASIDVVSIGPHARRSRLLFEKALGEVAQLGVIAVQDRRFDPDHWWRSSVGFRTVVGEAIAYLYARLFSAAA